MLAAWRWLTEKLGDCSLVSLVALPEWPGVLDCAILPYGNISLGHSEQVGRKAMPAGGRADRMCYLLPTSYCTRRKAFLMVSRRQGCRVCGIK